MLTFVFALAAAVASADQTFVRAVAAGDTNAMAAVLDQGFTWTDANGRTLDAAHVKQAIPKPAIANEGAAQTASYDYGSVAVVQANAGKLHTLRVWVKRPAGWRLLVYQEVKSLDAPATAGSAPAPGSKCENPCGAVPYTPKTATEREVMKAYTSLEEAAMGGKAEEWKQVAADEIALVSYNSDRTFDKATRASAIAKATLGGVAPTKLLSAKLFEFDNAVVMTSQHQAPAGNLIHITRVWVKRDPSTGSLGANGRWQETLSYQTAVR